MSIQKKINPLANRLLTTILERDMQTSTRALILETIVLSENQDEMTIKMQEIMDSSQNEEEILEKVEAYYQAIKGKN